MKIYNTLTSIYCLCSDNPQLAQRIVMDFTTYLRSNFTAIASDKPVPFSSELEHAGDHSTSGGNASR